MTNNPKNEQDRSQHHAGMVVHEVPLPFSIRMVIQRYRFARILLEESHVVTVGQPCTSLLSNDTTDAAATTATTTTATSRSSSKAKDEATLGLLAYISFSASATEEKVEQAAMTLLNMPVGTLGAWGDGSGVKSMLQLLKTRTAAANTMKTTRESSEATEAEGKGESSSPSPSSPSLLSSSDNNSPLSIILVPQANLIAKIKKNGKSIQYRDQIAKERGRELYDFFCLRVQELLQDHCSLCKGETPGSNKKPSNAAPDPSIPPDQLFRRRTTEFATFDETTHLPLTMINGDLLTKSARKRLQKQYKAHAQRHEKWCQKNPPANPAAADVQEQETVAEEAPSRIKITSKETAATIVPPEEPKEARSVLDSSFLHLVQGTFGARQGIELQSDMGPFCHVVEL
ncbi:MAG: hypothetical protein SGBAC_011716 [Bacillariaceae sp.]